MAWTSEGLHEQARRNLAQRTGKSFEEWRELAIQSKLTDSVRLSKHLEKKGLGPQLAWMVAYDVFENNNYHRHEKTPGEILHTTYPGEGNDQRRNMVKRLVRIAMTFGVDVRARYEEEKVTLKRYRPFLEIRPGAGNGLELRLPVAPSNGNGRVKKVNGLADGLTSQVELASPDQINDDLIALMRRAYREDMDLFPYHLQEQHRIT